MNKSKLQNLRDQYAEGTIYHRIYSDLLGCFEEESIAGKKSDCCSADVSMNEIRFIGAGGGVNLHPVHRCSKCKKEYKMGTVSSSESGGSVQDKKRRRRILLFFNQNVWKEQNVQCAEIIF